MKPSQEMMVVNMPLLSLTTPCLCHAAIWSRSLRQLWSPWTIPTSSNSSKPSKIENIFIWSLGKAIISPRTRMLWDGGVGWHEGNFMELPGFQKMWQVGTVILYVSQYHFIASQKWLSCQWWWKVCWLGFFFPRSWMKDVATNTVDGAICLCSSVFVRQWSCVQEVNYSIELSKLVSSLKRMPRL